MFNPTQPGGGGGEINFLSDQNERRMQGKKNQTKS